jgi:hypothetical protein
LPLHLPDALVPDSRAEFVGRLEERIRVAEQAAASERARTDKRIVGRAVVRRQHWNDSPRSRELRRGLDPRVACKNTWKRIEALARNKAWLEGYRRARAAFVAGVQATFPAGTYWLQRHAGVVCDPVANS